jgi:hypothetical protein
MLIAFPLQDWLHERASLYCSAYHMKYEKKKLASWEDTELFNITAAGTFGKN